MKREARRAAAWIAALILGGCGGGGGGGGGGGFLPMAAPVTAPVAAESEEPIVASSKTAGRCATPRKGIDPDTGAAFPDVAGTTADEKRWLRGWL